MKTPCPCRRCVAEAMVEATPRGFKVQCTVCPAEHQGPERKSREQAIRAWDKLQEERDEA